MPTCMVKRARKRIPITSSLGEIFTDQLENRVVVRGGEALLRPPLSTTDFWTDIYKHDVNCFSSSSDIYFITALLREVHCINSKSYNAQETVCIHSGPDSKVMHSFTTLMCFSQSSVMMMDTSPIHRIWRAKAIYSRETLRP